MARMALTTAAWLAAGLSAAAAQGMTGPIDTGSVRMERIQLSPGQAAPAASAPRRTAAPAAPSAARAVDIKAFYGSFAGSGLADGDDSAYFGVTQRDLDVRFSAAGQGGFTVAWTTVLRSGGDPKNPDIRRRETTMTFAPGPRPGLFTAEGNGNPLDGSMMSWARLARSTLTIYLFSVRDDGRHDIQTYARTLSGSGMDLVYTRLVDGERQRRVRGKLVKNAN
jgi:hypothetical protein